MKTMLSPWLLLASTLPVLLLGEALLRRVAFLERYNIPVPVVGGLTVALLTLLLKVFGLLDLGFATLVDAGWWTWLVTPEIEWMARPLKGVSLPFLVGFFTCIGLNATWRVVQRGSWQLPLFLGVATLLAVVQNVVGIGLAKLLGQSPLLGIVCGSLTLTGGHGTALGFAHTFEQAGFASAATVSAAAATFGLVFGSLVGGPVAAWLIKRHKLKSPETSEILNATAGGNFSAGEGAAGNVSASVKPVATAKGASGVLANLRMLAGFGRKTFGHLLFLGVVIKSGAWLSWALQQAGVVFPAYMGAMIIGVVARNALDLSGREWIDSRVINLIGGLLLGVFLAMAMTSLNLMDLAASAGPMMIILGVQVLVMIAFAVWVTFPCMGRDYDAAVIASGHCGFGLGATSNAVANMDSLARRYGAAARAFIVVPPVGALLIDFSNSLTITWFLNLLK